MKEDSIGSFILLFILISLALILTSWKQVKAEDLRQPVFFSHKTHSSDFEMACEFCHIYARRSPVSGMQPLENCFGCHQIIKGSKDEQKKEIAQLMAFKEEQKELVWKKIYDLPDFIIYSHEAHLRVGFDCNDCHGKIFELAQINEKSLPQELSMGWCLDCHLNKHPLNAGKVIQAVRLTRGGPVKGKSDSKIEGFLQGSTDCLTCHK